MCTWQTYEIRYISMILQNEKRENEQGLLKLEPEMD